MFVDTHSHLNFAAYDPDRNEVIKKTLARHIWFLNVGTNYYSSLKAVELTERYKEGVYAAVGLHPLNIEKMSNVKCQMSKPNVKSKNLKEDILEESFNYDKYKELTKSKKVVAIGEIGLDYWSKPKTKKKLELFKQRQREVFLKQLDLAKELNLPIIFHCRLAHHDLIEILTNIQKGNKFTTVKKLPIVGVIHCFTGNWQQAKKYLGMGFYLGFNGIIYKLNLDEIIKKTPLERLLIETDCPFLTPPQIKAKRNEPLSVRWVAKRIAEIKKQSLEKIAEVTSQNAFNLFNL